jgi:uncharacterized membrane protein YccC
LALSAGASLGIALTPHHTVGLVVLAFVSGAGAYARRLVALLGTRAAAWGTSLVAGYLAGFLGGQALPLHECYWYVAIVSLAAAVNLGLLLAVCNPLAVTRVPLLARSFRAQGQNVLKAAGSLLVVGDQEERERRVRRLDSGLARLNKNAVLTDAQLADPRSRISAHVAEALHESLFDGEIVLQKIGRGASVLATLRVDGPLRAQVAGWLSDLRSGHARAAVTWLARNGHDPIGPGPDQVRGELVRRLAELCVAGERALGRPPTLAVHATPPGQRLNDMYASPMVLIGGTFVGSTRAGAAAVATDASRLAARLHLDAAAQAAIRVALAVGAATAAGWAISEGRYYWAVIAVIVAYFGINTVGEERLNTVRRVAETVVGIVLGSLIGHAVGPTTWSLAVIIPALALRPYFIRLDYGLAVMAITIVVSQVYDQFGEYSGHLLPRRLEVTTVGAALPVVIAGLVFPVATRTVLNQASASYLAALEGLLERIRDGVAGTRECGA